MILSITSLKLKNPLYNLIVPYFSLRALFQLKLKSKCIKFKTLGGVGLTSYTMTLWKNEEDMNEFSSRGAHSTAMKKAVKYAKEIRILKVEKNDLISWKEAKILLQNAKVISF